MVSMQPITRIYNGILRVGDVPEGLNGNVLPSAAESAWVFLHLNCTSRNRCGIDIEQPWRPMTRFVTGGYDSETLLRLHEA